MEVVGKRTVDKHTGNKIFSLSIICLPFHPIIIVIITKYLKFWKKHKNTGFLGHGELLYINCTNFKQIGQVFIFIDICTESSCSFVYFDESSYVRWHLIKALWHEQTRNYSLFSS